MRERSSALVCERGNDLIAFLYGEVDQREARDFERHLQSCLECKAELFSFRQIRESVGAWRDESLSLGIQRTFNPRKRSAMAALRGFLDLSPLWMKGAAAFAAVLFCVVAVLAVARLFDKPAPVLVTGEKLYTEQELSAKVEAAVQSKLRDLDARHNKAASVAVLSNNERLGKERRAGNFSSSPTANSPKTRRRPLTKAEREQLAADLRLISPRDETDLDLLGDRINQ